MEKEKCICNPRKSVRKMLCPKHGVIEYKQYGY